MFYSVRPRTKRTVVNVRGIGVELPVAEDQIVKTPTSDASVAAIDAVEAGRVKGWLCHRGGNVSTDASAHVYAVVDGTVIASVELSNHERMRDAEVVPEIAEICATTTTMASTVGTSSSVFALDIGLPPLPQGVHELRVLVEDASGSSLSLVEAFHSPLKFEESANEPSMAAIIKRKDEIITHRNNLLTKLWNEVQTQLPWRRYERDAEDIPLEGYAAEQEQIPLAVILVRSDPSHQDRRDLIRATWGKELAENKMMMRFVVDGQFSGPHKEALDYELKKHGDVVPINLTADRSDEIDRVLFGLHHAVKHHDASFYFFVADQMLVMPATLRKYLTRKLNEGNQYMGCMKSGHIVTDEDKMWYEPQHWRFGSGGKDEGKFYPQHAKTAMYGFSRFVARHLARSKEVLRKYSNTDTTIGTWMLGLDVEYDDNRDFCRGVETCGSAGSKPMGVKEGSCDGICELYKMQEYWKTCAGDGGETGR